MYELIEKLYVWLKQRRCVHRVVKHYDREYGRYVGKCVKCDKIVRYWW